MLEELLRRTVRIGRLTIATPDKRFSVGATTGDAPYLDVELRLRSAWTAWKIAANPELEFGEAYVNGDLTIERGTLDTLFELIGRNFTSWSARPLTFLAALRALMQRFDGSVSPHAAARNVHHHYDLDERLYAEFLDSGMQYSCAYFARPSMSLDEAQAAKQRHLIAKLALEPGQTVLDIGCGWGGLAIAIAKACPGVSVLGVTLSREQFRAAERAARKARVSDQVQFQLADYRSIRGPFDRIISVGMFEHVGRADHGCYFQTIADLLSPDGVAVVHTIARRTWRGGQNPWIDKYIFPGGYIPSLSEITNAIEHTDLWTCDLETLRLHYAETLRHWHDRFAARRAFIRNLYDERFCRMWEFYLTSCEMAFRFGDIMVAQVQVAKRVETLPIVRDYMHAKEIALTSEATSSAVS